MRETGNFARDNRVFRGSMFRVSKTFKMFSLFTLFNSFSVFNLFKMFTMFNRKKK